MSDFQRDEPAIEPVKSGQYPVLQGYLEQNLVGFDPFTILMIISIGIQALRLLWECKKARSALQALARSNGPATRMYVHHKVYKQLIRAGFEEEKAHAASQALRLAFAEGRFDDGG
jgi:hypothetical protein